MRIPAIAPLAAILLAAPTIAQPRPAPPSTAASAPSSDAQRIARALRADLDASLAALTSAPSRALADRITSLFDAAIAWAPADAALLIDLDSARRLSSAAADPKNTAAKDLAPFMVANPELCKSLVLLLRADDDAPAAFGVLARLKKAHERELADKTATNLSQSLAAAICVVYDKPPAHPVLGEGTPGIGPSGLIPAIDPVEVFDFFLKSEPRLLVKSRIPRVYTNMVDVHSSLEDLRWAQQAYAGNQQVGRVYSSIVYDTGAYKFGREKKVFKDGYTLRNIKKVGGVCTEQAFFASEVAKAIGVPSLYITGDGPDVGHAWVGYLRSVGPRSTWDLAEGRFGDYKTVQGRVIDPQTGKATSDAFAALSEWMLGSTREKCHEAAARTDAAARLAQRIGNSAWPPKWPPAGAPVESFGDAPAQPARAADIATALAELKAALTACPGYEPAWRTLMAWSDKSLLDTSMKKEWGDLVLRTAGRDRPDLAFAVLSPMIRSAQPGPEQSKLWDWAATEFARRPDLVSAARLSQGAAWEKAGDNAKAFESYKDIITRFANEGRAILGALARAEALLRSSGRESAILPLYADAFGRTSKPGQMSPGFEGASNYYQVGARYAALLEAGGKPADATRIRRQIGDREIPDKGG